MVLTQNVNVGVYFTVICVTFYSAFVVVVLLVGFAVVVFVEECGKPAV